MSRPPIGRGPSDPAFAAAVALHRGGRIEAAAAAFRTILALRPDHPGAHHQLGLIALMAGRPAEALPAIARAAALVPRDATIQYDLGHALAGLGRLEEAADAWARAQRLAPALADAPANRGAALALLGRHDEAAQAFRAALAADPGHRRAAVGLAEALLRAGRLDEARIACDRARTRLGALAELAVVDALLRRAEGDSADAAARLGSVVAAAPDHAAAWAARGRARLDDGDAGGASE
ncbi:MAG: tetratricopeptide repeat protein, partial [Alphaproteobacteria bacterium]